MAVRRLEALERRLQREPDLLERVREQIVDYEKKGYAHQAGLTELTSVEPSRIWYLPLGVITNPRKPGKMSSPAIIHEPQQQYKNKHYVDDYLDSFETVEEAIAVVNEVRLVHSKGGFTLRRFLSNKSDVLQRIGEVAEENAKNLHLVRDGKPESVLGMRWIPKEDVFIYSFSTRDDLQYMLDCDHIPTKREELWAAGIGWDQQIPQDLNERWQHWVKLLQQLDLLRISRCYFRSSTKRSNLQLHLFVNSSESAYACAVYFRLESECGAEVALGAAKTKVAPLKTLSIPRLELRAAVLGVRLMETIQKHHTFTVSQRYCWSDASTVLAWIRSTDHRRYHKYIAVRVGEILSSTHQSEWRWVPSKQNVADLATKWNKLPHVTAENPWFRGPAFLYEPEERWPKQRIVVPTEEELRPTHFLAVHLAPNMVFERFNRWTKMHRVAAYVFRGIDNFRRRLMKQDLQLGNLTSDELRRAEEVLIKTAQNEFYAEEIAILIKSQGSPANRHATVNKCSSIYTLCPFLDEKSILRSRVSSVV
ncbi:uncharacterized protein LOC128740054 [Sabethes cyaneus]|uniref:uncharacterized protein LOC128740054 n=1 Tax=Sabethes cyaneus TaxID=53552 RepID=UPI00237DFBC3|nr:uncharacterized protein LOC128740054 [Sabethes cyaneus]